MRREAGVRIYSAREHDRDPLDAIAVQASLDRLVDVVVDIYAPLPRTTLAYYVRRLRYAAPQWCDEITSALGRAKGRLAHATGWGNLSMVDGQLDAKVGYVSGRAPRDRLFSRELDAEIERVRVFL